MNRLPKIRLSAKQKEKRDVLYNYRHIVKIISDYWDNYIAIDPNIINDKDFYAKLFADFFTYFTINHQNIISFLPKEKLQKIVFRSFLEVCLQKNNKKNVDNNKIINIYKYRNYINKYKKGQK